jgi:hypothetical protein
VVVRWEMKGVLGLTDFGIKRGVGKSDLVLDLFLK